MDVFLFVNCAHQVYKHNNKELSYLKGDPVDVMLTELQEVRRVPEVATQTSFLSECSKLEASWQDQEGQHRKEITIKDKNLHAQPVDS